MEPIVTIALLVVGFAALSLAAWTGRRTAWPDLERDGYGEPFQRAHATFSDALALALQERATSLAHDASVPADQ